jgi:hypothetical protein
LAEWDLIKRHYGFGKRVRNHLCLVDNLVLLAATGKQSADNVSDVIVRAFWAAWRAEQLKIR